MSDLFSNLPRGIRNNNWLNIKYSSRNHWCGLSGHDSEGFCTFYLPEYGIRAACIIFKNYLMKNPDLTLRDLIFKWSATVQDAYLLFIVGKTQILGFHKICDLSYQQFFNLIYWMSVFENGINHIPDTYKIIINKGLVLAGFKSWKK